MKYYSGCLAYALENVYSEFEWKPWLFPTVPKGFYEQRENRRRIMDWIGVQLGVQHHKQWIGITAADIKKVGGKGVLSYFGSIFRTLEDVYPGK